MTETHRNITKSPSNDDLQQAQKQFAVNYLTSTDLPFKFTRFGPPSSFGAVNVEQFLLALQQQQGGIVPGRPPQLRQLQKSARRRGPEALRQPSHRAELIHGFLHHELQAAELFLWAFLRFEDAPIAFRRGLFAIADDEIRHMNLYQQSLAQLGFEFGAFGVRDWFWDRVPRVTSAASFVATMSLGFEGGNLDHTTRFADLFEKIGE